MYESKSAGDSRIFPAGRWRRVKYPEARLPEARVSFKGGTATAILFHGLLVLIIIWTGIQAANRLIRLNISMFNPISRGSTAKLNFPLFRKNWNAVSFMDLPVNGNMR